MRYATGAAFRMALEDRLRDESLSTGLPLSRLRKTIAFDRLLARMVASSPDAWLLKGGFALQGCGVGQVDIDDGEGPGTGHEFQHAVRCIAQVSTVRVGQPGLLDQRPLQRVE